MRTFWKGVTVAVLAIASCSCGGWAGHRGTQSDPNEQQGNPNAQPEKSMAKPDNAQDDSDKASKDPHTLTPDGSNQGPGRPGQKR
jgi:hypothetical protein